MDWLFNNSNSNWGGNLRSMSKATAYFLYGGIPIKPFF